MKTKETLEIGQKVSWIVRNTNITGVVLNDDLSGQVIVISHLVGNKPHNQEMIVNKEILIKH
jgi:hypothetical protein|tara:strand:- start:5274 stop:5459 length:186 start_codon:yes stop_codon:yes gene_type:complete